MVGFVGPLEECFVHFGLGVGGQFDEFPKQRQRVFELDVVHDLETVHVSAYYCICASSNGRHDMF